jgi:hypothetical protein
MQGLSKVWGLALMTILAAAALGWAAFGDEGAVAAPSSRPAARATLADLPPAASPGGDAGVPASVCTVADGSRALGAEIHESSGVAVSRAHAGVFWTHNDSGEPLLYAVDGQGRTAGRVRVSGAAVEDWEDLALAPCPAGGDCLYVADIGDNDARRPFVTVYRVPEPEPGASASAPATAIRLRYPDGAHDAEAMFVLNGAVHVVTKGESGPIALYRAPADAGAEAVLERVRSLSEDQVDRPARITSADARADGRWVVLRTLHEAAFYPAAALAGSGEAAARRVDLRALGEAQGEGIAFGADGSVYVTSEGGGKNGDATFARLSCTLP